MAEKQTLVNQLTRAGITDLTPYEARINAIAGAYGRTAGAADELTRAQRNIVGGMDEIRSGGRGLLTGAYSDARQGKDPTQGVLNSLGSMSDRLFDRTVSKPAMEWLLGPDGKPGGGAVGNAVSSFFGEAKTPPGLDTLTKGLGATTTATMTVTAAVVNLSGGAGLSTGSLPGLGGAPNIKVGMPNATGGSDEPAVLNGIPLPPARPMFDTDPGAVSFSAVDPLATITSVGGKIANRLGDAGDKIGDSLGSVATDVGKTGSSLAEALGSMLKPFGTGTGNFDFNGFDIGGYTGHGGRLDPAGIVHRGEVVWSQADVARYGGPSVVDAMRRGYPGYAEGGLVTPVSMNIPMLPANTNAAAPAGPTISAPITIHMEGSSGDPAKDQAHVENTAKAFRGEMERIAARTLSEAMRTGGQLHQAGVRRAG